MVTSGFETTQTTPAWSRRVAFRAPPLRRGSRGGALIEMALCIPVLIMLAFGTVEYGTAMYLKNSLQGAASEAGRVAATPGATATTIKAAADRVSNNSFTSLSGKPGYAVATNPANVAVASGSWITVTVQCKWSDVGVQALPSAMGGINPNKVISATVTVRKE